MEHERILHILEYLTKYSNEERSITIRDIQAYLADNCNLRNVSSLTVRRDIDRLITAGHNIQVSYGAHHTAHYRMLSGNFTFNEIRFIVDSISINQFLSNQQKQQLIKKFEVFCSEKQVRQLISRIELTKQIKPSSDLLVNLEKVHTIISHGNLIHFDYGKYDTNKKVVYYKKHRNILPCKVIYFDDRFYLKCKNEENGAIRTYRIDRMRNITEGGKSTQSTRLPKLDGVILDMFEPDYFTHISLQVKRFLLDEMLERFGDAATVREISDEWLEIDVRVGVSQGFYRWVLRYGENIRIAAPEDIREQFLQLLQNIFDTYKK